MDIVTSNGQPVLDLPPHILQAARMMARDCAAPGEYFVRLVIPAYRAELVSVQTVRVDVIRTAEVARKTALDKS